MRAQVTDCEAEGLEGMQSALGEYELDSEHPERQNVYFTGIRIEPTSSDPAALRAWLALLRDSNPSMVLLPLLFNFSTCDYIQACVQTLTGCQLSVPA